MSSKLVLMCLVGCGTANQEVSGSLSVSLTAVSSDANAGATSFQIEIPGDTTTRVSCGETKQGDDQSPRPGLVVGTASQPIMTLQLPGALAMKATYAAAGYSIKDGKVELVFHGQGGQHPAGWVAMAGTVDVSPGGAKPGSVTLTFKDLSMQPADPPGDAKGTFVLNGSLSLVGMTASSSSSPCFLGNM